MSSQTSLILTSVLGAVAVVASLIVSWWVTRKQDALFTASTVDDAVLREKCQIRIEFVDCPGVVLVVGDTLVLRGVLIKERRLPLSQIKLKKETAGTGKYYWWGKRLLHLEAPGISELAIGVENPEPWRHLFRQTMGT
jgi:hypothetical protein